MRAIFFVAAALVLSASGCTGLPANFFSGPRVIRAEGSFNPARVQTVFVHTGQTAYALWRSRVLAYGGTTYAHSGASVQGFDDATIYYHRGAYVETHGQARAFLCPGADNAPFETALCVQTR